MFFSSIARSSISHSCEAPNVVNEANIVVEGKVLQVKTYN